MLIEESWDLHVKGVRLADKLASDATSLPERINQAHYTPSY